MNDDLKNYLGQGRTVSIIGIDGKEMDFTFKPLGMEHIPDLFRYMKSLERGVTEEDINILTKLIEATVKKSYPDWDEAFIKDFSAANFAVLSTTVLEINKLGSNRNRGIIEMIEARKKAMEEARLKEEKKAAADAKPV